MSMTDVQVKYPADGNTRIVWVPGADGIADIHAPTVTELAAGVDISCEVQSGGLDLGVSSGVIDGASICSSAVAQSTGRTTVSPTLTCWRYRPPADVAWALAEKGSIGYLAVRSGIDYETEWDEDQEVWIGLFEMGEPAPSFPGGDTNSDFSLNFNLVDGTRYDPKAVVGAGS